MIHYKVVWPFIAVIGLQGCILSGVAATRVPAPTSDDLTAARQTSIASATIGGILSGGAISAERWDDITHSSGASVYRIRNETCSGLDVGSGFAIDSHTLVTARHVVAGAQNLTVDGPDGISFEVTGDEVASADDLAVIRLSQSMPSVLSLASADPVGGDLAAAVGYPLGGPLTGTTGRILGSVDGQEHGSTGQLLSYSVPIKPGNSGGPLIDAHGQVVGVVIAIDLEQGNGLAVPVSTLRRDRAVASFSSAPTDCSSAA